VTRAERTWMSAISRLGCVVCHLTGHPGTIAEIHHLLSGGRRIGHKATIPLCVGHHRAPEKGSGKIARHPTKVQFERAYGTEGDLLRITQSIVEGLNETV